MCYEFIQACESPVINSITRLSGADHFFLICIGQLNYFHCNDRDLVAEIKTLLSERGIHLHRLSEYEMTSVINHSTTMAHQVFHGDNGMFEMFRERACAV